MTCGLGGLPLDCTQNISGGNAKLAAVGIMVIPAYNTTKDRLNVHPKGRDNGYQVTIDGTRIYISGNTEGTPEMRALENIDVAFVCMNLTFTTDAKAAAKPCPHSHQPTSIPTTIVGATTDPKTPPHLLKC